MPLQTPLTTLFALALAASTLLAVAHGAHAPSHAVTGEATALVTPYGSGAAVRNLLF